MAQTFAEFRDKQSDARRGKLLRVYLGSLCIAGAIFTGIIIVCALVSPPFLIAFTCLSIGFAAFIFIPPLAVGIKAGFDFISDLISYHSSRDNKESEVKIERSYSKTTEELNTTTTNPTNKVEQSPSLIERFNKTTVGMKIQYVLSFIDGTSKERRLAIAQGKLAEIENIMFEV